MENNTINKKKEIFCFTRKQLWIAAAMVLLLLMLMWIWKGIDLGQEKKQFSIEREAMQRKAVAMLTASTEQCLKLLSKPYSLALQQKMLRKDYDGIDLFNNEMIRQPHMIEVMVVNNDGIIEVSTNKKNEKKNFLTISTSYFINTDSVVVEKQNDSVFLMASPIMNVNNRLGTLVVKYATNIPEELQ